MKMDGSLLKVSISSCLSCTGVCPSSLQQNRGFTFRQGFIFETKIYLKGVSDNTSTIGTKHLSNKERVRQTNRHDRDEDEWICQSIHNPRFFLDNTFLSRYHILSLNSAFINNSILYYLRKFCPLIQKHWVVLGDIQNTKFYLDNTFLSRYHTPTLNSALITLENCVP